jgi:TPR repeat protein
LEAQREPSAARPAREQQPSGGAEAAPRTGAIDPDAVRSTFDGRLPSAPGEQFATLMDAARQGSPEAMVALGAALRDGLGAPRDQGAARCHFEQAARLAHPPGMREFAHCLLQGRGGAMDVVEGFAWLFAAHAAEPMESTQELLLELAAGFPREALKRGRKRGEALSRYYARARKRAESL